MKKFGHYLRNPAKQKKKAAARRGKRRNPVPFALTTVNPAKKRRAKKTRRKNPAVSGTQVRKVGDRKWHHRKGRFLYTNPAGRRRKRRKNPLEIQHVITDSNRNPMSKKRKRRNKRSRNPVSHKRRHRSTRRRHRNPMGKSRRGGFFGRRRNPVAIVSDVITRKNVETGLGVLTGVVGTGWLVNKLIQGDPVTGVRMFDLPGVTYSTAAMPLTQAQFTAKNKWVLGFYEAAIPAVAGWLLRNKAGAFSEGLMQSTIVNVGIAALRSTQIGNQAGLNAFLPRGMKTYIPGVPPMLSGPATAFINNGAPVGRGMGAVVDRRWQNQTVNGGANPFKKN